MSNPNNLTNPAVSASGEVDSLLIEKHNNQVHEQYLKGENLLQYFDVQSVVGTNSVSNKYLGDTEVQVLAPGKSPDAKHTETDKNRLVIDTTVVARNTVALFHDVQNDINGLKSKLAVNQAKQLKKMEDSMVVQQLILGGISNTATLREAPRVSGHGFSINVVGRLANFTTSPQYLMAAIELALEKQIEQEVDTNELCGIAKWTAFNCLRDADRIVDKSYTIAASDNTIDGFVLKSWNLPIVPSNRFPKTSDNDAGTGHHKLSNAGNSFRYDITAAQMAAQVVLFTQDALLVGRTLAVTGDIFFEKKEKTYYIDTFMAEGAIPDRWEAVAVVSAATVDANATDHDAILARANRKVIQTKAIS